MSREILYEPPFLQLLSTLRKNLSCTIKIRDEIILLQYDQHDFQDHGWRVIQKKCVGQIVRAGMADLLNARAGPIQIRI